MRIFGFALIDISISANAGERLWLVVSILVAVIWLTRFIHTHTLFKKELFPLFETFFHFLLVDWLRRLFKVNLNCGWEVSEAAEKEICTRHTYVQLHMYNHVFWYCRQTTRKIKRWDKVTLPKNSLRTFICSLTWLSPSCGENRTKMKIPISHFVLLLLLLMLLLQIHGTTRLRYERRTRL